MRHGRKRGRKLGRTQSHRKAMLRNMVTSFFEHEQVETTDAKARELRSLAERLVTLGKRGANDLAARRRVARIVRDRKVATKLFTEIAPRYADRPGGYTRILKVGKRLGDAASLSILQFVTEPLTFKERKPRQEEEAPEAARPAPAAQQAPVTEAPVEAAEAEAATAPSANEAGS